MKEMRLMQIIGDIDEKYIDEAAPTEQKKKGFWARTKEKALAARSSKNK